MQTYGDSDVGPFHRLRCSRRDNQGTSTSSSSSPGEYGLRTYLLDVRASVPVRVGFSRLIWGVTISDGDEVCGVGEQPATW